LTAGSAARTTAGNTFSVGFRMLNVDGTSYSLWTGDATTKSSSTAAPPIPNRKSTQQVTPTSVPTEGSASRRGKDVVHKLVPLAMVLVALY